MIDRRIAGAGTGRQFARFRGGFKNAGMRTGFDQRDLDLIAAIGGDLHHHLIRLVRDITVGILDLQVDDVARFDLIIGPNLRLALMGAQERLSAERALQLGIVTEVVSGKPVLERAKEIAKAMLRNSPEAMRVVKKAIWAAMGGGTPNAQAVVAEISKEMNAHPDFVEGPRAFAEKRKPAWKDPGR